MNNLAKSILGLFVYAPLCLVYVAADHVAGRTERILKWFEVDLPTEPDSEIDGDDTDDIVTEPDYQFCIENKKEKA